MNRRLNRLNDLMIKAGSSRTLLDPVGLSDEENDKIWDAIIQKDKDEKARLDAIIQENKTNLHYQHEH